MELKYLSSLIFISIFTNGILAVTASANDNNNLLNPIKEGSQTLNTQEKFKFKRDDIRSKLLLEQIVGEPFTAYKGKERRSLPAPTPAPVNPTPAPAPLCNPLTDLNCNTTLPTGGRPPPPPDLCSGPGLLKPTWCPKPKPTKEEAIPAIKYKGTLNYDQTCWSSARVDVEQQKGLSEYPPKPGNVNAGLDAKRKNLEDNTCYVGKGLECIDLKCKCAIAFKASVLIDGACYLKADSGQDSHCKDDGIPLPTGDTYYKPDWNSFKLPCPPNSDCKKSDKWVETRCSCKKGSKLGEDGSCSSSNQIHAMAMKYLTLLIACSLLYLTSVFKDI